MKYFWQVVILALIAAVWFVNSTRSDVKLFCSYGRVFIEFHDGGNVWGTIMLDNDGLPIPCETNIRTKLKDTI